MNSDKLFTPASNTKIFTSWFALEVLGENYEFYSEYSYSDGTLYIKCRGNPLLGCGDVDWLVEDQLSTKTVERVVLDRAYLNPDPRPPGWCFDDLHEGYAPPVDDVCFNLNRVEVRRDGGGLRMNPDNRWLHVDLDTSVDKPRVHGRSVSVPASRLEVNGEASFSYPSPPRFLLEYVADALMRRGAATKRPVTSMGRMRGSPSRFAVKTMAEVLRVLNKNSENIVAELLLLHAGLRLGANSRGSSLEKMRAELDKIGVAAVRLHDGSGLSRYNLASPRSVVKVLERLVDRRVFLDSLPVGSVDGTLSKRLNPRVRAKTGSLLGVRALSGYADHNIFSIIVNHALDTERAVEDIDDFVLNQILG